MTRFQAVAYFDADDTIQIVRDGLFVGRAQLVPESPEQAVEIAQALVEWAGRARARRFLPRTPEDEMVTIERTG